MKLYTKNVGSNYLAKVVTLPTPTQHPNADRLALVSIDHQTVIVGKDAKDGDTYIYFPIECKINADFLRYTNSFSNPILNADGKTKGFFNDKGRVRAVKLRGTASEGYLVPATQFYSWLERVTPEAFTFALPWNAGLEFDSIKAGDKDILVCEKYVPPMQYQKGPANLPKKDKTRRFDRMVPGQFHLHDDTASLKKNIHVFTPNDIVSILYKMHGTNFAIGNVLTKRKLTVREKIARFFGVKVQETEYGIVYSSRNVIKSQYLYPDDAKINHWYKEDIWGSAKNLVESKVEKGITLYCEIVGYTSNGNAIQKHYDYGMEPNTFGVFVFRITYTNYDGVVTEFTTPMIQQYCAKHDLQMVPIEYYGRLKDLYDIPEDPGWGANLLARLSGDFLEKPCKMCKNHVPAEGIVLIKESLSSFYAFKLKCYNFLMKESEALDKDEVGITE